MSRRRSLPLRVHPHPVNGSPTVVLHFKVPSSTGFRVSIAAVQTIQPTPGQMLRHSLHGMPTRYIEFLPEEEVRPGRARILAVEMDATNWSPGWEQLVVLSSTGVVAGVTDISLVRRRMQLLNDPRADVQLCGAWSFR